jgi:hypothetical protein
MRRLARGEVIQAEAILLARRDPFASRICWARLLR